MRSAFPLKSASFYPQDNQKDFRFVLKFSKNYYFSHPIITFRYQTSLFPKSYNYLAEFENSNVRMVQEVSWNWVLEAEKGTSRKTGNLKNALI